MLPDRVSNPGPLTYESGAPPIALRGPAPHVLVRSGKCTTQMVTSYDRMIPYLDEGYWNDTRVAD